MCHVMSISAPGGDDVFLAEAEKDHLIFIALGTKKASDLIPPPRKITRSSDSKALQYIFRACCSRSLST